jgi:hypothetical protein
MRTKRGGGNNSAIKQKKRLDAVRVRGVWVWGIKTGS